MHVRKKDDSRDVMQRTVKCANISKGLAGRED